jgi:hypothetical protein
MAWPWGIGRPGKSADTPLSQGDDTYALFMKCFFIPMLADGRLDSEEFTPLEAAYFGLNVDATPFELFKNRLLQAVQDIRHNGVPSLDAGFCEPLLDAWQRKIDHSTGLPRISENQREELFKWISATLHKYAVSLDRELKDREQQKFGGDGEGNARDTRYQSHLRTYGVAKAMPSRSDREQLADLFREISNHLKSIEDTASLPTSPSHPVALLATGRPATAHAEVSAPAPSGSVPGHTSIEVDTKFPLALPSLEMQATSAAAVSSAGPTISGTPTASPQSIPEPPKVIEQDLTALLSEHSVSAADRQAELLAKSKQLLKDVTDAFGDFSSPTRTPLAFSRYRTSTRGQVIAVPATDEFRQPNLWFIGDIHGDILALDVAVRYIDTQAPNATIIFLGDLFDDQGYGYEVVLRVFELIVTRPQRIGYVVGNHDIALGVRKAPELVFSSSVSPSDFADFLNDHRNDSLVSAVGSLTVQFFQAAPRSIFLPDGLIATHAGVPLGTRWESIKSVADLEREDCLQDFTWTRAHERARKKIPNPNSKTSEFGFEDFSAFCDFATSRLGIKAERLVRGHDHFETGYSVYPKWIRNQCVTINTMARRLPRDPFGTFYRTPCVARWVPGKAPEVHRLTVPGDLIDAYYSPAHAEVVNPGR